MARRTYSLDFKVSAAALVAEQGRGPKDVATSPGVAPGTLQYWVRRFGTPAVARARAPSAEADLRRENDRPRDENERLLMEREVLRTISGYVFCGAYGELPKLSG